MENKISAFLKSFLRHVICMSKRRPYQEIHLSQLNASDVSILQLFSLLENNNNTLLLHQKLILVIWT